MLGNFIKSLKKYNYDYAVIGEGQKWTGFMTKIKGYRDYIKELKSNQLVACVDAYDVLATGPPDELIRKYYSYDKSILVGTESLCIPPYIPVDNWWKFQGKDKTRLCHINSGFFMGPAKNMVKVLNYMLSLENKSHPLTTEDDQVALAHYINEYPDDVALDTDAKIVANISVVLFHHIDFQNDRIYHNLTDEYPCFTHTPAKLTDLMTRTNYVGSHVLGDDYQSTSYSTIFNGLINKIEVKYIIIIIFLAIIALLLAYYFPILLVIIIIILIIFIFLYTRRFKFFKK
jgi:hypothetical protein